MISVESKYKRSKHILTKVMYVRDLVTTGSIVGEHIGTDLRLQYVVTKPLSGKTFESF
jgi:hypothetical protein